MTKQRRRRQRDPELERRWRRLIERWQRRGGTVRGFCADEGINENSFHAWRRELRRRDAERQSSTREVDEAGFVELVPAPGEPAGSGGTACGGATDDAIEIVTPGGLVLRVRAGFDAHALAEVLALIRRSAGC